MNHVSGALPKGAECVEVLRDIDCTIDTPVLYGHPAAEIYGRGIPVIPLYPSKRECKYDEQIYLKELLPLEMYDRILVLFSGGKDSLSAYFYLRELGVPKEKIELWHHDLDGGHPNRIMDWPVTLAYVDAFAKAEGVRLRVSRRVNGFWGEVFRVGASYPIEYEEDDGTFAVCGLSDQQYESDRLRLQIMRELSPGSLPAFENSAELNRAWCAQSEELLLQDIVTVEMDQLDKPGNKRIFPEIGVDGAVKCYQSDVEHVRDYISRLKHGGYHLRLPAKQALGRGRYCTPTLKRAVSENVIRSISDLKHLQSYHLRLPAIQAVTKGRYCTSVGKDKVFNRAAISLVGQADVKLLVVSGERRGESKNRAAYNEMELHATNATKRGHSLVHWWRPVIDHTERDVWERIRRHRCVPHPCYMAGWNRCSCMMCIFSKREQWAGIRELFPAEFERLANDEKMLGYTMHIGMPLEEYVGDAKSCVCHDDPRALRQLVEGTFSPDDIYADEWTFPNGAFKGSEGGPC